MSDAQMEQVFAAWPQVEPAIHVPRTDREYRQLVIIDDMPGTALNPFVFDVNSETSWPVLAEKIIRKHID